MITEIQFQMIVEPAQGLETTPRSVFKAPLMNLRQLENKVFKNFTGFKKPGRILFKMFS